MAKRNVWLFYMFFISGFCSLVYQVVWLRLAFAAFGITTPVISVLLSVFMLGLSVGSWLSGKFVRKASIRFRLSPVIFYGIAEAVIGVGAFAVPALFAASSQMLLRLGEMDSLSYLSASGALIAIALLPWCVCMGATFPLMMAYIKRDGEGETGFSFLYSANVAGAMAGAALTAAVFVETLGFTHTLWVAALGNFLIAAISFVWGARDSYIPVKSSFETAHDANAVVDQGERHQIYGFLFVTGFCSMAMEVVWTRAFTPMTQTTVYAFAFLLTTYLLATRIGSVLYRKQLESGRVIERGALMTWLALAALLPLVLNDPRLHPSIGHVFISIFPFCALLGYLTPQLIDRYSGGRAELVGSAYSVNVLGCILGPLAAGYALLPTIGAKWSMFLLAIPFAICAAAFLLKAARTPARYAIASALAVVMLLSSNARTFEEREPGSQDEVRRDHTATVISLGTGMRKYLFVNGVGMTSLTPITKVMAHLPLSSMRRLPDSALVICFGMGTTFRSIISWDIDTTVVELVPSVKDAFGYYHADARQVLSSPKAHVVIDDGRRFLTRTSKQFDLITLDPPPPVEAAGSSLLYSTEFYALAKSHLKHDGVLQQWFPGGEDRILHSVARSLRVSFPYVKVYRSIEDWGYHFLASNEPIPDEPEAALVARMPERAKADLLEWYPSGDIDELFTQILSRQSTMEEVIGQGTEPATQDDRPYNEYFLLRRIFHSPRLERWQTLISSKF